MDNKCSKKDVVINIKDLFMHICLRWRSIVLIVLAFSVLTSGYKFYADYKHYVSATTLSDLEVDPTVSENDRDAAYLNAVNVANLYKQYINRNEHIDNSPLMKINANAVPTYSVSYAITGNDSVSIVNMHSASIFNGEDFENIKSTLGADFKAEYLSELITVVNNNNLAGLYEDASAEKSSFTVTIIAPDMDSLKIIAEAIKARILINYNTIKLTVGNYGMDFLSENYSIKYNAELLNKQYENSIRCNDAYNIFSTAFDKLTDEEKEHYENLINDDFQKEISKPSISKKYLLLGFVGGFAIAVCIYAATYVFGNKIKGLEDAALRYDDLYFFGAIKTTEQKKKWFSFVDNFIKKKFDKQLISIADENNASVIKEKLILESGRQKIKTINLISSALTVEEYEKFADLLLCDGLKVKVAGNILDNPKMLSETPKSSSYLIVEKTEKTYYSDVYEELELLTRNQADVLGAIVLY